MAWPCSWEVLDLFQDPRPWTLWRWQRPRTNRLTARQPLPASFYCRHLAFAIWPEENAILPSVNLERAYQLDWRVGLRCPFPAHSGLVAPRHDNSMAVAVLAVAGSAHHPVAVVGHLDRHGQLLVLTRVRLMHPGYARSNFPTARKRTVSQSAPIAFARAVRPLLHDSG